MTTRRELEKLAKAKGFYPRTRARGLTRFGSMTTAEQS